MKQEETITLTMSKQRYNELQKIEKEIISGFDPKKDQYCVLNKYSFSSFEAVVIRNADDSCKRIIQNNIRLQSQVDQYEVIMRKLSLSFWVRLWFLFNLK